MKLNEIISSEINKPKSYSGEFYNPDHDEESYYDYRRKRNRNSNNKDHLGAGMYSTVKDDKKDPHMVVKYQHRPVAGNLEGGFLFAKYVMQHNLWENPCFPRFYNLDQYVDSANASINKLQMEKLTALDKISMQEYLILIETTFDVSKLPNELGQQYVIAQKLENENRSDMYSEANSSLLNNPSTRMLGKYVTYAFSNSAPDHIIINENVLNARKQLISIYSYIEHRVSEFNRDTIRSYKRVINDIHYGNVMVRRTPNLIQPVITDPFAVMDDSRYL